MIMLWIVLAIAALILGLRCGILIDDTRNSYQNAKKHGRIEEWKVDLFGLKKGNYYVK